MKNYLPEYHCKSVRSIDELNHQDWNRLCSNPSDGLMDLDFLGSVEATMSDVSDFWFVICYEKTTPVACACFSTFELDASIFMPIWAKNGINFFRRVMSGYLKLSVLFCGLPVSVGENHLRISVQADTNRVLAALDKETQRIARLARSWIIIFKEFGESDASRLQCLEDRGYVQADSLPTNIFPYQFDNLDDFSASLRSHYRYKINRSRKKFSAAGLRVEHILDPQRIINVYTPQVHQLYEGVEHRSEYRVETLPYSFFLQLAKRMPGKVSLTTIFDGDEVVGFAWGLSTGTAYRDMFVGYNPELNDRCDLYFNLMMHDLEFALRSGANHIAFGQTADCFKSRLGCVQENRRIFVKGATTWFHNLIRIFYDLIFPPFNAAPPRDLFRDVKLETRSPIPESETNSFVTLA